MNNEIESKSEFRFPNDYFIDYIGLLGNPENLFWTQEEENRVDKIFEEIKALAENNGINYYNFGK